MTQRNLELGMIIIGVCGGEFGPYLEGSAKVLQCILKIIFAR